MTDVTRSGVWRTLTVGAMVGMAFIHLVSTIVIESEYPVLALVIELPLLMVAGLVATGRRWAAAVAAGLSGLLLLYTVVGSAERLTQPHAPEFVSLVLWLALALAATTTGVGATLRSHPAAHISKEEGMS